MNPGGRGGAVALFRERPTQRRNDQRAHPAGIPKANLGFRRMDIHIHPVGRHIQEERQHGKAPARHKLLIARPDRALEQPVAHGAAVDEQILRLRRAAVPGRQAGMAGEAEPVRLQRNRNRVLRELRPQHVS